MSSIFSSYTFDQYAVRKATKDDAKEVFQILRNAASWLNEKNINQWEHLHNDVEINEIMEDIVEDITYIVENKNTDIVAVFNFSPNQNPWDIEMWGKREDKAFYLHRFAVHQEHHHKQIGKRTLEWMINSYQVNNSYIRLDCIGNNPVLNKFYQRAGFQFMGHVGEAGDQFSLYEKAF